MSPLKLTTLLVLFTAGCGFSTPEDLACNDYARARCDVMSRCSNGVAIQRTYGNLAHCEARYALSCMMSLHAPGTGSTAYGQEECAVALDSQTCGDAYGGALPSACHHAGSLTIGEPCAVEAQCASGFCGNSKIASCGTCVAPLAAGDACVDTPCPDHYVCTGTPVVCVPLVGQGLGCGGTAACTADLTCILPAGSSTNSCQPSLTTIGAACGGSAGNCDGQRGLSCQGATGLRTCQLSAVAGDGQPCNLLPDGTYANCGAGGGCYTDTGQAPGGVTGTCKAAAADGAPCDSTLGPPCLFPARCVPTGTASDGGSGQTCQLPDGVACQ